MNRKPFTSSGTQAVLLIYLPWLLSVALQLLPELSYVVAWLGSFFIFYLTIHSGGVGLDSSVPRREQLMKPIIIIQVVFAGFMCSSSIFFFLDHHGYKFFEYANSPDEPPEDLIYYIAKCQRLCLLAHCALVTGILSVRAKILRPKYSLTIQNRTFLLILGTASFLLSGIFNLIQGTSQLGLLFSNLSLFSGTALFVISVKKQELLSISLGAFLFLFSLGTNLFTGYKESIIVHLILLSCMAYPLYPNTVRTLIIPTAIGLLTFLPSFTKAIRQHAWTEQKKLSSYSQLTRLSLISQQSGSLAYNNWEFLRNRSSEIGMFTQFVKKVPEEKSYYDWAIVKNALIALIPRILWPSKPNTEKVAMKRIYELGIANPHSSVSAKSRPVVDGYLSAGAFGVFVTIFGYGFIAQSICNLATRWFAGEITGCAVVFNGLFQQLWRGNNLEFILNNIIYGLLLMTCIFYFLRLCRILVPQ